MWFAQKSAGEVERRKENRAQFHYLIMGVFHVPETGLVYDRMSKQLQLFVKYLVPRVQVHLCCALVDRR